jgi:hypothetical protein
MFATLRRIVHEELKEPLVRRTLLWLGIASLILVLLVLAGYLEVRADQRAYVPRERILSWSHDDPFPITTSRGDLVVAALERHYAARGEYPKKLRALVPEYIPALPRPADAETWHYAREGKHAFRFGTNVNGFGVMWIPESRTWGRKYP